MINQNLKTKVLKNKVVLQNMGVKSKMFFVERETLSHSAVTDYTFDFYAVSC